MPRNVRLSRVLAQHASAWLDLDIESRHRRQCHRFRVVVVPGRGDQTSRMCTHLPRTSFSAALVTRLYRFQWQIELCFKEWKSYANLHRLDTANPHIAAGLIWAGLCAALLKRFLAHAAQRVGGGAAISTRRVAMCAHLLLADLVRALLRGRGLLRALQHTMRYLLATARRADVLRAAVEQKVAFVPGESFFADGTGQNIARLNFSNATPERIEEGVRRLARCLEILIARRQA